MVFGNMGDDCATGVCFTRDPSTGENMFYGEYLVNAQGEDVVAGIRTPQPMAKQRAKPGEQPMEEAMPEVYERAPARSARRWRSTTGTCRTSSSPSQQGKLYMLQTRNGKRTAAAACASPWTWPTRADRPEGGGACGSIRPRSTSCCTRRSTPRRKRTLIGKGLPASPGAASGAVVFNADEAESRAAKGEAVILVRIETSPEDIHGMHAAQGILTTRGGMTSHAAVVARGMGRPCVAGAGGISVDYSRADHDRRRPQSCMPARSSPSTAPPARCSPAWCR